jgi:hypothetical protein
MEQDRAAHDIAVGSSFFSQRRRILGHQFLG